MTKQLQPLKDHYGQELNIGDLVLGARVSGGRNYQKTEFKHCIVVGRTAKMVRLHQVWENSDRNEIIRSLKERGTRRGGIVLPSELIRLEQSVLSRAEVDKYHDVQLDANGVVLPQAKQIKTLARLTSVQGVFNLP